MSREAPVLILDYDSTEIVPGGAGNAAKQRRGARRRRRRLVGVAGRDETGRRLLERLKRARRRRAAIVRPAGYRTPTKTRILAGGVHSAKQQVVRIDRGTRPPFADAERARRRVARSCGRARAPTRCSSPTTAAGWSRRRRARARAAARAAGPDAPPVLVDSRYALLEFRGMTACTPNESEVEQLLGIRIGDNVADAREGRPRAAGAHGQPRRARSRAAAAAWRCSSAAARPIHIPIVGSDQIADVTGAGDTVIATMTLALAAGATFDEAARLANYAGGLVVMKRGTATVSADELRGAILSDT